MNVSETIATPILVLGETRRRDLSDRLGGSVRLWLQNWSANVPTADVVVNLVELSQARFERLDLDSSKIVESSIESIPHMLIAYADGVLASILKLPTTVVPEKFSGAISNKIREEVLIDLANTLVSDLRVGSWSAAQVASSLTRENVRAGFVHGWLASVEIGGHSEQMKVLLSAELMRRLHPQEVKLKNATVSRRRTAIADESIRLEAVLGEATVSLGDLARLAIDDVIVLGHDISRPGSLLTDAGREIARFSPGKIGGKRAAQVTK